MKRFKNRMYFRKIFAIVVLGWLVSINQACSINPKNQIHQNQSQQNQSQQDLKRIHHAHELLAKKYQKSDLVKFEGDFKLADYIRRYIGHENSKLDAEKLTEMLLKVSREQGYDPVFLLAVIKTESKFNPNTVGLAGEIGLMQIKPGTAKWICKKKNIDWLGVKKLKDPSYNVLVGAAYFHYLKTTLDSKSQRYINAYNMGINNLQRLPALGQNKHPYYGRVISNYLAIYSQMKKYRQII